MNYTLMPTLEHIAHVKIATLLWNHDDVRNSLTSKNFKSYSFSEDGMDPYTIWESMDSNAEIALMPECSKELLSDDPKENKHCSGCNAIISEVEIDEYDTIHNDQEARSHRMRVRRKIESKVMEKVSKLLLPKSLKGKVASCIKPVGLEILKWIENHVEVEYLALRLPTQFCWTPYGTIDKKKTAETLIRDEKIHITKRYKLACIYCLEKDVKILWDKIPKDHIMFEELEHDIFEEDCLVQQELVNIWNNIFSRGKDTYASFKIAFQYAAYFGYEAATQYYFYQLTPREQEEVLVEVTEIVINKRGNDYVRDKCFTTGVHADVLMFLLSRLKNQQQVEMLRKNSNSSYVLESYLGWPWQSLFLKVANYVRDFFHEDDYRQILHIYVTKVKNGYEDCNYQKLFYEFLKSTPETHKKYFDTSFEGDVILAYPFSLLKSLFEIKDKESISFILKDATNVEKHIIFHTDVGRNICVALACKHEWDLLEFFITESVSSREKLKQFREELKQFEDIPISFFQFLDNLIQKRHEGTAKSVSDILYN